MEKLLTYQIDCGLDHELLAELTLKENKIISQT